MGEPVGKRRNKKPKLGNYRPTLQEIEAAQTPAGGWTRETLAKWGVSWPPRKGWRQRLERLQQAADNQYSIERMARISDAKIKEFYNSWEWKRLSYEVKLERGRKCECCGAAAPEVRIITDHVKPLRLYWHLRLVKTNLQVLCDDCNRGKASWDETDFRPSSARMAGHFSQ